MEFEKDEMKQLIDMAVAAGRHFQSVQTGFIHYNHHVLLEDIHHAIPIYENFLFPLALLRKRTVEDVSEAKLILDKLLHFQTADGNFPIYLHEFPQTKDRYLSAYLLPIFYWILAEFSPVLGQALKDRLENSARTLLAQALTIVKADPLSDLFKARFGGSITAFGRHYNDEQLIHLGQSIFKEVNLMSFCPQTLGDFLIGSQLVERNFDAKFQDHLAKTWNLQTVTFAGPAVKDFQMGFEPQVSIYDYFMGYFSHQFSKRALAIHPVQLQTALVQPMHPPLEQTQQCWSLRCLPLTTSLHPCSDRGRQALRLIWGTPARCHSFVCEGGNLAKIEIKENEEETLLLFHLADPIQEEDREKNKELLFFVDAHDELEITVDNQSASTFFLGQTLQIKSDILFQLHFSIVEGQGDFIGHIMRGNRPSQNGAKGVHKYSAFDWQIAVRTLRRSHPCQLQVRIKK